MNSDKKIRSHDVSVSTCTRTRCRQGGGATLFEQSNFKKRYMTIIRSQYMKVTTPNAMRSWYGSSNGGVFHVHESLPVYAASKTLRLGKNFFPDSQGNTGFLGIGLEKKNDKCENRRWRKYVRLYNRRQNFRKGNFNSTWQHLPLQTGVPGHQLSKRQILFRA